MIFQIDKQNVFASDAGKGIDKNKHTILLLHGSGLSHIVWSLTEQYLSNQNHNVLSLDLPGHGNSEGKCLPSIEIENAIAKHPSVSLAAVVAKPDEKWGETPCAFVELIKDKPASEKDIIDFCRETLAGFKLPKKVIFCDLPKTSTGKIQKFELRKKVKELT